MSVHFRVTKLTESDCKNCFFFPKWLRLGLYKSHGSWSIIWPRHKLWGRGSERPAAHTQQKLAQVALPGVCYPRSRTRLLFSLGLFYFRDVPGYLRAWLHRLRRHNHREDCDPDACLVLFSPSPFNAQSIALGWGLERGNLMYVNHSEIKSHLFSWFILGIFLESAVRIYYRYHKSECALFFLHGQVHADPRLNLISTLETV